jgi:hypothetical protein
MFFQRLLGGKPSLNGLDKKAKGRKKEEEETEGDPVHKSFCFLHSLSRT